METALVSFIQGLVQIVLGLINEQLIYIVIGSLVATQAAKLMITYFHVRTPTRMEMIFIVSPLSTLPVASETWTYNDRVPWYIVAIAASLLANIVYILFAQKIIGSMVPQLYERINFPVDRRKRSEKLPEGTQDRRRNR
jgi:hypothetical protein